MLWTRSPAEIGKRSSKHWTPPAINRLTLPSTISPPFFSVGVVLCSRSNQPASPDQRWVRRGVPPLGPTKARGIKAFATTAAGCAACNGPHYVGHTAFDSKISLLESVENSQGANDFASTAFAAITRWSTTPLSHHVGAAEVSTTLSYTAAPTRGAVPSRALSRPRRESEESVTTPRPPMRPPPTYLQPD